MSREAHSSEFPQRLLRYSAVASLAAAGVLAGGPGAVTAEPVVIDVDPDVVKVPNSTEGLDFDDNGTNEFTFRVFEGTQASWIDIADLEQSVHFLGKPGHYQGQVLVSALRQGDLISAAGDWIQPQGTRAYASLTWVGASGYWLGLTEPRFLGLRYVAEGGDTRYGWVELTVVDASEDNGPQLTIHRYGQNTTADAGITAGEGIPSAVEISALQAASGLRAVSAAAFAALAGVFTWLRRKVVTSSQAM